MDNEKNIHIEEFILIAECSKKIIKDIIINIGDNVDDFIINQYEMELRKSIRTYYFNNHCPIDKDIPPKSEIFDGEATVDIHVVSHKDFSAGNFVNPSESNNRFACERLKLEYGEGYYDFIQPTKGCRFFDLFLDLTYIKRMRKLIINNKNEVTQDHINQLEFIVDELCSLSEQISMGNLNTEVKLWRDMIIEQIHKLLMDLTPKDVNDFSDIYKAFILNTMLDVIDVNASKTNKQKFIAKIIATTEETVKGYFLKFDKSYFQNKNKELFYNRIEKSISLCKLLNVADDNDFIKKIVDKISEKLKD